MNKVLFTFCLIISVPFSSFSQKTSFNTTLLSYVSFGSEDSNDIWGYKDENGIWYAVIGNERNTRVYSLEDPTNPILRHTAPGAQSVWRDIKSYNKHLYVTTDQGTDGLVIIDMTNAPNNISHTYYKPNLTVGTANKNLERCHNLYIDEKGFCYLSGCNISKGGVLIFDLKIDPKAPQYVGAADLNYSHDNFARGDTLYSSEINAGQLGIYDIRDRSNPVFLAGRVTSRSFTHNAWPSTDSKYIFTTDERPNAYVDAYDISDLSNIKLLDKFRPLENEGDGVIPHNTHYFNGYILTSWYTEGLRIVDAHRPDNLIEVAYYDTWNDPTTCHSGFSGCWGAFPFAENNHVYASDINNGLFVVKVDYKRAAYLEGTVKDEIGNPVEGVRILIKSDQVNREFTDAAGVFKTGHAFYGNYTVEAIHPDFKTATATLEFNGGQVTEWNVVLEKPRQQTITFNVKSTDNKVLPAKILITNTSSTVNFDVNESGSGELSLLQNSYTIYVTSWGYVPFVIENYNVESDGNIDIVLTKGYSESFETDNSWEIIASSANMRGIWQRAAPRGTFYLNNVPANPGMDSQDYGTFAFVTENGIPGATCGDVDNGITTLISPNIDVTSYTNPEITFSHWFFTAGGNSPFNDSLKVYITNGETEVLLLNNGNNTQGWETVEKLKLKDEIVLTAEMRVIVEIGDDQSSGHIVEAGFDNFRILDGEVTSSEETILSVLEIIPNPAYDRIQIQHDGKSVNDIMCFNAMGQNIALTSSGNGYYDISMLPKGLYVVKTQNFSGRFVKN
ncbi:MAG: choice-of-anchor B family protein [Saprospiraceae bacterium]|nr:choice-of-anchor B family protein [Saprospiraceae bacterium]